MKERKKKLRLAIASGNSIVKILNFRRKERGWTSFPSRELREIEQQKEGGFLAHHLFFLSLGVSYNTTLLPRPFAVPCRDGKTSLRIVREIPRRQPILIDLLILRRFNSAPRASLNEDVVNALFPSV